MNRNDIEPGSVYVTEDNRYVATGDPVELDTRIRSFRNETRVVFHPVDTAGDPYRFDPAVEYDVDTYQSPTAATISESRPMEGRTIARWVCTVDRWPAYLAQLVADRAERVVAQRDENRARRADVVSALAGLMAGGEDPSHWEKWLASLGAENARTRRYVAEALYEAGRHTGGPGSANLVADAEDYADANAQKLRVFTRAALVEEVSA